MYVSVRLTSGLGNRCFQVYAMLGYAERHGRIPVFVRAWIDPCSHPGSHTILDLFPEVLVVDEAPAGGWTDHVEHGGDTLTYVALPTYPSQVTLRGITSSTRTLPCHVLLTGSFQSERYFPSRIVAPRLFSTLLPTTYVNTAFLHVRRGDYLSSFCQHHCVDLSDYYRKAVTLFPDDTRLLICSDDLDWCREELPRRIPEVSWGRWLWADPAWSDAVTWAAMIACDAGGICANSTFSWFGGVWNPSPSKRVIMPGTWGYAPMPVARDVFPACAIVVQV
jgi:hypothetical protein